MPICYLLSWGHSISAWAGHIYAHQLCSAFAAWGGISRYKGSGRIGAPGRGRACRRWAGGRWAAGGGRGAAAPGAAQTAARPATPAETFPAPVHSITVISLPVMCFPSPGWCGTEEILSTVSTVNWVLLGSGESNKGYDCGSLHQQFV